MEPRRTFHSAETTIRAVSRIANSVGMAVLIFMMLVTVADVFLRYAFNRPILGTIELCEYMMVAVVYLALPLCAFRGGNARVEILTSRFPPKLLSIVDSITCFLSLGILSLMTWQAFLEFNDMLKAGRVSDMLGLPAYPFYLILAIGSLILWMVLLVMLIQTIYEAVKQ
jgi:TRAP-type C4-dicarboxylate transport system permease small subunit